MFIIGEENHMQADGVTPKSMAIFELLDYIVNKVCKFSC